MNRLEGMSWEQIKMTANNYCREAVGFEGGETFPDCEDCIICDAKKYINIRKKDGRA